MGFEKDLEEQVDAQHQYIVDTAPEATILLDGKPTTVKCVLVGEDQISTYWDAETYAEVFPDE